VASETDLSSFAYVRGSLADGKVEDREKIGWGSGNAHQGFGVGEGDLNSGTLGINLCVSIHEMTVDQGVREIYCVDPFCG
jgi:hypothetical protein